MAELPEEVEVWELNFDAPGRRDYMKLVASGLRQDLARFFSEEKEGAPRAVVYSAEVDDMEDDGAILQRLGGRIIGKLNYDHPERTKGKKDTLILVTREDFEAALKGKAKTLARSKARGTNAFRELELRVREGRDSASPPADMLMEHYQGDPFDKLPESFRNRIEVALRGMKGTSLIDIRDVTGDEVKKVEQLLDKYSDILVTHFGAPHHTYHKVIGPDGEVCIYRVNTLSGDQLTWGEQKSVAEIVAETLGLKKDELECISGTIPPEGTGRHEYYKEAGPWYGKKPMPSEGG